jgi:2-methylcitrate dehydratase PrpD
MTFKNHACCGHTFAAIDGALELKKRMQLKPEDIEKIEVATYKAGVEVAGYENPATAAEGRFSLKYVVATALTHGSVRLAAFSPQRLADETTKRVMQKISVSVDAELEAAFPAKRQARVAIQGKNGRAEWLQPTRIGDPDAPLSDRALEEKYFELVAPVIGEAKAREVLQSLWRLQ